MPEFGKTSTKRLNTCDHRIQDILNEVIKHYDLSVLEGHRSEKRHKALMIRGSTKVSYSNTMHRHNPSKAVDITPYPIPGGSSWGKEWKDRVKFYELAAIVLFVAETMGIKLRWGGDWDGDYDYWDQSFDDLVHFELVE